MEQNVIWLASYPKSGNTWFRVILTNLLTKERVDYNNLENMPISSARSVTEQYCGFDTGNLTHDEADLLRPQANNYYAQEENHALFRKCHDAYSFVDHTQPLLGSSKVHKAVYLIRNPLSITASLANHNNVTINKAIEQMASEAYFLNETERKYTNQHRQKLFSWSSHVKSWLEQNEMDVLWIRYEDLASHPKRELQRFRDFCGLNYTDDELMEAYQRSSFDRLQNLEKKVQFREKPLVQQKFFRKGRIDSWKEELTREQVQKVIKKHKPVMQEFGYYGQDVIDFAQIL